MEDFSEPVDYWVQFIYRELRQLVGFLTNARKLNRHFYFDIGQCCRALLFLSYFGNTSSNQKPDMENSIIVLGSSPTTPNRFQPPAKRVIPVMR